MINTRQINGDPITEGYFVQMGPFPFLSDYERAAGGTTLHWLGTCLRQTPNDFHEKTLYNRGENWPVNYEEMMPYYRRAEYEIGVSGDVKQNAYLGIHYAKDYVFPMAIPQSYLDLFLSKHTEGMEVELGGKKYPMIVSQTPQGRNGNPNPNYNIKGKKIKYIPTGAAGNQDMGHRCEGSSNCVPICPVQAKYNANKTMLKALATGNVEIRIRHVASTVAIDPKTQEISGINYKEYAKSKDGQRTVIREGQVQGKVYMLATHAVENAKILLASNAGNSSGQVGKNLMDHLVMLTWGLAPEPIGAFRGPGSTSGVESLRDGDFRREHSSFRIEIGNWGWNWPETAPLDTATNAIDKLNLFGDELRDYVKAFVSRQFRIGWELEQLPSEENYVTIDPEYRDDLGNYRPVIHYDIDDYLAKGAKVAKGISDQWFQRVGVQDYTVYNDTDAGYFEYENVGYTLNGAGHLVGTHRMGDDPETSVVDADQRSWDHKNLYVAGCGSHPTIATANPSLTMAALAYKSIDAIIKQLDTGKKSGKKRTALAGKRALRSKKAK